MSLSLLSSKTVYTYCSYVVEYILHPHVVVLGVHTDLYLVEQRGHEL